jgi:hypothetical protein
MSTPQASTAAILAKCTQIKQGFIIFLDHNKQNFAPTNMAFIDLPYLLKNFDSLCCDWDMELSPKEIAQVKTPAWREALKASMHF